MKRSICGVAAFGGGAQRNRDRVVLSVFAEEAALGLGVNADDGVLGAIDHHRPIHRRSAGEKRLRHVGADQRDVRRSLILLGRE